jgi:translation initiation factor IF-3
LVGADGSQIGIKPLPEALAIAREQDLDLVEVAAQANPPVCRIMDYGKWKYEAAQQAKESRRKASNVSIKEMKYRPKIGAGDFDTKTRKVEKFLAEGHKVKVTIMFRGRETQHPELGRRILDNVADRVVHIARVEAMPKLDGRNMIMVLAPDKKAKALWDAQRKAEAGDGEAVASGPIAEPNGIGAPVGAEPEVDDTELEEIDEVDADTAVEEETTTADADDDVA